MRRFPVFAPYRRFTPECCAFRFESSWGPVLQSILRFLFSGGLATLAHWTSMALLVHFGFGPAVATALGATIGALLNYVLQYHLTFRADRAHRETFPRYVVVVAVGWCANLGLFTGLQSLGIGVVADQGITSVVVAVLNYWLYRTRVFHGTTQRALNNV